MRRELRTQTWILIAVVMLSREAAEARAQSSRHTPFTEAVKKVLPSVLSLKVEQKSTDPKNRATKEVGSAFLVDDHGYAVTNSHVIHNAKSIHAYLSDGKHFKASLVAEEPEWDLAIIKLETDRKLPFVTLGSSSDLIVGERILTVGNPMGYSHSVSQGILSAASRKIPLPGTPRLSEAGVLQTDLAINGGNSGGPVANINGEVIGMIFGTRADAQGISFAIPSDCILQMLCRHLSAKKLYGVQHELILVEKVNSEEEGRQGVVIVRLESDRHADLHVGDQIVSVGARAVENRFDVERAMWLHRPGENVHVQIRRNSKAFEVVLKLPPLLTASK